MAELTARSVPPATDPVMVRLHCWPCRRIHSFTVEDVERIVYALGADAIVGRDACDGDPDCLNEVRHWSGNPDLYAGHVEHGIKCRTAAGEPPV